MSYAAQSTPNGWKNGWWSEDEDAYIQRAVKRMARKLRRDPSTVVTRIAKLNRAGKLKIWESE